MSLTTRVRPRIGDVIEIPTGTGMAYAHYSHKRPPFGALLRVMPGIHAERPDDFAEIVKHEPQFMTFFPLGAACYRNIVCIVANEPLSPEALVFPTFRTGVRDPQGKVETWWLWDGEREWKVGALTPNIAKLPLRSVWNDTLLIERIVSGWRHEHAA